jgi:hypothetical protein
MLLVRSTMTKELFIIGGERSEVKITQMATARVGLCVETETPIRMRLANIPGRLPRQRPYSLRDDFLDQSESPKYWQRQKILATARGREVLNWSLVPQPAI